MITFTEHEKDPGIPATRCALEPKLRAKIARDETINLGEIAAELGVSLDVADFWIALLAVRMGAACVQQGMVRTMAKNFIQPGDTVTLTAPIGDVSSGDLIVVGNFAGVCAYDAAAGEEVEVTLTGVWELPKASGQINEGAAVWWSTTDRNMKNVTCADLYPIGVAVRGAGGSDTTVRVRLSGVPVAVVGD
jgi:predicted RecA/RadA family phage recombinase